MSILRTATGVFALTFGIVCTAAEPTLEEKLQILQQEIDNIKAQLAKSTQQQTQPANAPAAGASAGATPTVSNTTVGGYGEFTYNKYRNTDVNNNQADLRRFVLFFGHRFNDSIRFYSELEFEHAVVSSGDRGEAELEQAFV